MTISRRLSVGTRHCLTYSTKVGPFIGPSRTNGATIRSWRRPATKVMVFQCPCGAYPTSRMPRAQRPRSRTILVLVAVSSIKTSRAGSSKPCSRIQRRRARATSARCCSAAYRLFFEADIVAKEEATHGAATTGDTRCILGHNHLVQCQIWLSCNQIQKPFRIVFQPRYAAAAWLRRGASSLAPAPHPIDDGTRTDIKVLRHLAARSARSNLLDCSLPQVTRIWPRHRISPRESNRCRENRSLLSRWESPPIRLHWDML